MIPDATLFYPHALAAYKAGNRALQLPDGWTLSGAIVTVSGLAFGYVATSKEAVMVSFRGTHSPEEWLRDFEAIVAPGTMVFSNGVHAGFQSEYNSLRASVFGLTAKALHAPPNRLLITGHSLGAALATIFALDAARTFNIQPEGCTFAGPRVGLPAFAIEFDAAVPSFSRVTNHWDVVCQIPVPPMYKHVGSPILIDGGFTTDLRVAHSLPLSYLPGLQKLKR